MIKLYPHQWLITADVIPITSFSVLSKGPPEFPSLTGVSV